MRRLMFSAILIVLQSCSQKLGKFDEACESTQVQNANPRLIQSIREIKVPVNLRSFQRSFSEVVWEPLKHWMFPVFDSGVEFDRILRATFKEESGTRYSVYIAVAGYDLETAEVQSIRIDNYDRVNENGILEYFGSELD